MFKALVQLIIFPYTFICYYMHFLSRISMLTRDIDIAFLSVRSSVRLSITFRY